MKNFKNNLRARLGRCRSGKTFDMPHELNKKDVEHYLSSYAEDDLVDIFCMLEALMTSQYRSSMSDVESRSLSTLHGYFWKMAIHRSLEAKLELLGLRTSPQYVSFGQAMLLHN